MDRIELRYASGEEIRVGDQIRLAGRPGHVVFVLGADTFPDDWADSRDWFATKYRSGFMLNVEGMGHVFKESADEDLELVNPEEGKPIASSSQNEPLEAVFRKWAQGSIGEADFVSDVFNNLTPDNLHMLFRLAGANELEVLRSGAADAPTTEQGWSDMFFLRFWRDPSDPNITERLRRENNEAVARFRRGIETFRRIDK
jgi:hypothetical protein